LIVVANGDDESDRVGWTLVVACCHSAKLCTHVARALRSQLFYVWQKTGCRIRSVCFSKRKTGCGYWDTT